MLTPRAWRWASPWRPARTCARTMEMMPAAAGPFLTKPLFSDASCTAGKLQKHRKLPDTRTTTDFKPSTASAARQLPQPRSRPQPLPQRLPAANSSGQAETLRPFSPLWKIPRSPAAGCLVTSFRLVCRSPGTQERSSAAFLQRLAVLKHPIKHGFRLAKRAKPRPRRSQRPLPSLPPPQQQQLQV